MIAVKKTTNVIAEGYASSVLPDRRVPKDSQDRRVPWDREDHKDR